MKKIILLLSLICFTAVVSAETDAITKHSGKIVNGKVLRIDEYTVFLKYDGEDAENSIVKYTIKKIVYCKIGKVEEVTEKIILTGEADWQKVVILKEKFYLDGLKKAGEVRGKTGVIKC